MDTGSDGARLHARATRGEELSAAERERLDAWYAAQDAAEWTLLTAAEVSPTASPLHAQIATTASQLQEAAQRVHELAAQNEALRQEITALQRQLAQRATSRVA